MKKESIKYSLNNLRHRKFRSILTIVSILIGVATIFIFISFGMGLYNYIQELSSGGSADKIIIQAKGSTGSFGIDTTFKLTDDDLDTVKKTSGVYEASGLYFKAAEVVQGKKKIYTFLFGFDTKTNLVAEMSDLEIIEGRKLDAGEKNIILGYNYLIPDKIFPKAYSLGEKIKVQGRDIKIAGFYDAVGNPSDDAQIYVTGDFMKEIYNDENLPYNWIVAKVDSSDIDKVVENVEKALRKERNLEKGKEDFFVQSFNDLLETYGTVLNLVIGFVILIALISILVSAVNTANTMITSVLERVKEIGIMKSIGATNSEIFGIFLFESSFLGFVAGTLGVILGVILTAIAGAILAGIGYSFLAPYYSVGLFLGCIAFAVLTGAISGIIPAVKAMKTNPVRALRYE
jgi:putative ABC transport system permease protein